MTLPMWNETADPSDGSVRYTVYYTDVETGFGYVQCVSPVVGIGPGGIVNILERQGYSVQAMIKLPRTDGDLEEVLA